MTALVFPDNTVLINFAHIRRLDVLERVTNGRGRWCATVATECARSAQVPGLDALHGAPAIFGEPLRPETGAEHLDVRMFRLELARPGDPRHQHLGEAETLAIMTRRDIRGIFVTDDAEAARLAHRHKIGVATTWDVLRLAQRTDNVDADALWGYLQTLRALGRGGPRSVTSRSTFTAWLAQ